VTTLDQPVKPPTTVPVVLSGIPVRRFLQLHAHLDALLDELAVIAVPDAPRPSELDHLLPLLEGLTGSFASARRGTRELAGRARTAGAAEFDLDVVLPRAAAPLVPLFNRLLDEADAASSRGLLLTPPAAPEVVELRRWISAEIEARLTSP
jgi:hypothetical protein